MSLKTKVVLEPAAQALDRGRRSAFAAVLAAGAVLVLPAGAHASLHTCAVEATNTATISSARDMSCATAAREMKRYRGEISTTFKTPGGFACGRVSGGPLAGQWRCTRGHKAYRFEFRD